MRSEDFVLKRIPDIEDSKQLLMERMSRCIDAMSSMNAVLIPVANSLNGINACLSSLRAIVSSKRIDLSLDNAIAISDEISQLMTLRRDVLLQDQITLLHRLAANGYSCVPILNAILQNVSERTKRYETSLASQIAYFVDDSRLLVSDVSEVKRDK